MTATTAFTADIFPDLNGMIATVQYLTFFSDMSAVQMHVARRSRTTPGDGDIPAYRCPTPVSQTAG